MRTMLPDKCTYCGYTAGLHHKDCTVSRDAETRQLRERQAPAPGKLMPTDGYGGSILLGTSDDDERMVRMLAAVAPLLPDMRPRDVCSFLTITGEPYSKSRPRFSKKTGHAYPVPEDVEAETRTGWEIKRYFPEPWTGNIALGCVFFRSSRHRVDVDNLLKHVADAGNGVAWQDDSQITAKYGIIELDREHPRTLLVVARHYSTLMR